MNLKAYRESAGYTQDEFSSMCGVSRQSLHKHESGKCLPSPAILSIYAKRLGVSESDLKDKLPQKAWNFAVFTQISWS